MNHFQPLSESRDLSFPNQGHLRANGLYGSSLSREYIAYITLVRETEDRDPINVNYAS